MESSSSPKEGSRQRRWASTTEASRISADGGQATVLGYGLRQPNIGVNVRTDWSLPAISRVSTFQARLCTSFETASFTVTSPKASRTGKVPRPIADPLTWIPHSVNASATSQVWLFDPHGSSQRHPRSYRFQSCGTLPSTAERSWTQPQASVISITSELQFPPCTGP